MLRELVEQPGNKEEGALEKLPLGVENPEGEFRCAQDRIDDQQRRHRLSRSGTSGHDAVCADEMIERQLDRIAPLGLAEYYASAAFSPKFAQQRCGAIPRGTGPCACQFRKVRRGLLGKAAAVKFLENIQSLLHWLSSIWLGSTGVRSAPRMRPLSVGFRTLRIRNSRMA